MGDGSARLEVEVLGVSRGRFGEPHKMRLFQTLAVARRELMPETIHDTGSYANNRAELSHQPTRARERGMRHFNSPKQAQRFLSAHAVVYNLSNLQRHLASGSLYRLRRARAFECRNQAVAP